MKSFMDENFLLQNKTAEILYHECAKNLPIIDYHCHINPKEIAENLTFDNITQLWLGHDHYKWRLMRSFGVEETYITGPADPREKFEKWAYCLSKAIGNPLYHWSHLELQRYFDYNLPLNENNAYEVYQMCNEKLCSPSMSARELISQSNVRVLCTTDDPADSLSYHKILSEDKTFKVLVLPSFRPDRAMNIEKKDFTTYLSQLSAVSDVPIYCFADLKEALIRRMDYFASLGCKVADHGLSYVMYTPVKDELIEGIFRMRLNGMIPNAEDEARYKTALLLFVHKEYAKRGWVSQLHFGCKRDNNQKQYQCIGPDTGYDCIGTNTPCNQLADFLNALELKDSLPKTILYSLNPNDNAAIDTIAGCFQDASTTAKIQHGCAWWFNDNKSGIQDQLCSLSSLGNLSGFIGMLTDSRSFLSYTRHEYFRRILCNLIGTWVENGEYPSNQEDLFQIVSDISYNNSARYFNFDQM